MTTMPRLSAGLRMYRIKGGVLQALLAHPGGPCFVKKDEGARTIPKGEPDPDEDLHVLQDGGHAWPGKHCPFGGGTGKMSGRSRVIK